MSPHWPTQTSSPDFIESKYGTCLSRLRQSGNGWGEYRLVSYVGKDSCASDIIKSEAAEIIEEKEDEIAAKILKNKKRKRKRKVSVKRENDAQNKDEDNCRWKLLRYERAKTELLAVMKAKETSYQNPIPRKELREAARKHIGDTGLLDHLLLHVVDKLAPGGTERFRRRCDPQGLMEYWLESADMMDIRRKAGVLDLYWTPPPGWKLGDPICNSSDCAAAFRALKEEVVQMREAPKNNSTLENLTAGIIDPANFKYEDLLKEKARLEQKLVEISKLLKKIETENS